MILNTTTFNSLKKLHVIVAALLLVKLCLLFFTQTIDADAVTRTQLASHLLENPRWISEGVWPPLHIYITSFSLWAYNDVIYSPRIMNILLSVLTLYPIFFFLKREFIEKKAFIGVLIFACSPIIFHLSLMNLSEISFYLFIAIGINCLSLGLKQNKVKYFMFGGLVFTLAAAIRMEAWPLIGILTMTLLINKRLKQSVLFLLTAAIFPAIWMTGNYAAHDDPLFSIKAINILESADWEDLARKIWFFPLMLFISIGPIFIFALIKGAKQWRKNLLSPWVLTPLVFFGIIIYKSITGTMIAHPRFIGLSTLLFLPLVLQESEWINKVLSKRTYIIGSILLTIGLSFIYNINNVNPLPMIKNKEMISHSKFLNNQLDSDQSIFIDFLNWEDTYFISLQTFSTSNNQIIVDGYTTEVDAYQLLDDSYNNLKEQFWILKPSHRHWIESKPNFEIIRETENVIIAISNAD